MSKRARYRKSTTVGVYDILSADKMDAIAVKPSTDDVCGKSSARRDDSPARPPAAKKRRVDVERLFKCNSCGKSYARPWNLARHETVHAEPMSWITCDYCGKSVSRSGVSRHKKSHGRINLNNYLEVILEVLEGKVDVDGPVDTTPPSGI